jgi:hypothetical protein
MHGVMWNTPNTFRVIRSRGRRGKLHKRADLLRVSQMRTVYLLGCLNLEKYRQCFNTKYISSFSKIDPQGILVYALHDNASSIELTGVL